MDYSEAYLKNVQASYRYYCYHVHNGMKEAGEALAWHPSRFHRFLCDTVQNFVERETDKAFEILILNTPPQHGKSTTVTETFPAYWLCKNPEKAVITISYGDDLAERFGKRNLEKVKQYGGLFGVKPNKKKSTAREFELDNGKGRMISKGFGSGITGHRGNLILIDDPIKNREQADSETQRDSIWSEFEDTVKSRTSAGAKIILIMTRWHEDDLAGRIIKEYPDRTTVINLPCEAEENDLLGRKVGDALCNDCPPLGKDNNWLKDFKTTFESEEGVRAWNALYQGRPTAKEGNMLKREWWEFYDRSDYDNGILKIDQMIMTVDAAFKDQKQNDYVAIGVWGKKGARIYMIDMINEHLNLTATIKKIKLTKARYPQIGAILIEDKANGTAIIQMLKMELSGIIPVNPDTSKETRVNAVSFIVEAGNVYLPRDKKITWEFIDQCSSFPNGKHDDMVDTMTMGVNRLALTRAYKRQYIKTKTGDRYFNLKKKTVRSGKGEKIHVI